MAEHDHEKANAVLESIRTQDNPRELMMKIKDRTQVDRRFNAMKNEFNAYWYAGYKDIQRFILPDRGFFFESIPNYGQAFDHKTILNSAPRRAVRKLAAGMLSGLTSPSRPWFKLGLQNRAFMENEDVKMWLEVAQQELMTIFSMSNIYESIHQLYEEEGGFGTGAMIIEEDYDRVVNARVFTGGEYFLGQNKKGYIDSFARIYNMTVGQLVEEFGIENVTPAVKNQFEMGIVDKWVKVCHLIEPNNERIPDRKDYPNMPFRSIQWEYGAPSNLALRIGGYDEFPLMCPRWARTTSSSIYGWGLGHHALGDAKQLMRMEKDKLILLAKMANPPIQKDATIQSEADTLPGGVTVSSGSTKDAGVRAAYQVTDKIGEVQASIDRKEQDIEDMFLSSLFVMLNQFDAGKMTATEVSARMQEKLTQLGPVIESQENELLDPLIMRCFNIGIKTGVIPMPPEILDVATMKVEYISILAQAQKEIGTAAIEQVVGFAGEVSKVDPNAMDIIDVDEAITEYAEMKGVPPNMIRSKEDMAIIRQQKQQAMAEQQQAAAIPELVKGAKTLSDTQLNNGSALDALVGSQPPGGSTPPAVPAPVGVGR
jgi:hypothetical protein